MSKIFVTSDIHGNKKIIDKIENFLKSRNDINYLIFCGDITGKHFNCSFKELIELQKKDLKEFEEWLWNIEDKGLIIDKAYYILANDDWVDHDWVDHDYEQGYSFSYLPHQKYISRRRIDFFPFELVKIAITNRMHPFPIGNKDFVELAELIPFNTNREANENKIRYELEKLEKYGVNSCSIMEPRKIDRNSIIVAHESPFECLDVTLKGNNVGSKSVREFIKRVKPKIWLCGHIHEGFGQNKIGNTLVFNCACDHIKDLLRGWLIDTENLNFEKVII